MRKLDTEKEVEVVFRPLRRTSSFENDKYGVIEEIKRKMDEKYPNLKKPINRKLRSVVGISRDISKEYGKYSDKEIIAIGRMEKYLEKGEIIETLF